VPEILGSAAPAAIQSPQLRREGAAVGETAGGLRRHFGLLQATALNVTMIVGAGVFATIPLMLLKLPGPWALLGWLGAGALILVDGLIWSELGAAMPGSGGTYLYLLESYGRERWGRLMAFLFIWQFLLSGPLEIASGLIAMAQFSTQLSPAFEQFNAAHTATLTLWAEQKLAVSFGPSRLIGLAAGALILLLLYRRITALSRLTVAFWVGVLGVMAWILLEGAFRFDAAKVFAVPDGAPPLDLFRGLGGAMVLAMYSYLGYYNICYIGDEVRDPGRTIPRSILLSALLVVVLFVGLHLAMLGAVPPNDIPTDEAQLDSFSLAATFMRQIHGEWAATLVTLLLVWSCFGSAFAGLLGYSRIPYGAARYGHFFSILGKVHRVHLIPHISLLAVGGLVLFWSFFDLGNVINALIVTRILEQFVAQAVGLMVLRRTRPEMARPFRMWLYPLPCLLALAGWLFLYGSAGWLFIGLGLTTLAAGVVAFLAWSRQARAWPFGPAG
jgi:amino acid transporter